MNLLQLNHQQKRSVVNTNPTAFTLKLTAVVTELNAGTPAAVLSQRYKLPRTTIFSWETQLHKQNKEIKSKKERGVHLCTGSGRALSYPKVVDEELVEWVLCRRDSHLPVSSELIKAKAKSLIKAHNPQFKASKGWLEKFMIRHSLSLRSRTSISQKLPPQLESKLESFLNEVRILRTQYSYPLDMIINMDETPMFFDMVPGKTVGKKGVKEVRVRSSGAEKRRLTVVLSCAASGDMLPALAIFKGKRKLKFMAPSNVLATVQCKGWMDSELMSRWFKAVILPYTKGRRALLLIDSFSAHESVEFIQEAQANNVQVSIIPGGCTSKVQPLDVCLNKPFKTVLRSCWHSYIDSLVATDPNPEKLKTAEKETICDWIEVGLSQLQAKKEMVKKSFLVCGISNALDGTQNSFIHCAKELPDMQLPYLDESTDDPFQTSDSETLEDESPDKSKSEFSDTADDEADSHSD